MMKAKLSIIIIAVALSLCSLKSGAQTFGIRGGLNISDMLDKNNDITYSEEYMINQGFHLGVTMDVPLSDHASIESGVFYSIKGIKYEAERIGGPIVATADISYIDVPITFKLKSNFEGMLQLYGFTGPYIGLGLKGKKVAEGEKDGTSNYIIENIIWGNNKYNNHFKRLEMGLVFGGGIEFSYFTLGASYNLGLNNIAANQDNGTTIKNSVLMFSLGFRIPKFYVR